MEQNTILDYTQDTETEYSPCICEGECIEIDGRRYPVLCIFPIKDKRKNTVTDTASDKFKYLISGGKK